MFRGPQPPAGLTHEWAAALGASSSIICYHEPVNYKMLFSCCVLDLNYVMVLSTPVPPAPPCLATPHASLYAICRAARPQRSASGQRPGGVENVTPRPALPRPPMAEAVARTPGYSLRRQTPGREGREEHYETLINV